MMALQKRKCLHGYFDIKPGGCIFNSALLVYIQTRQISVYLYIIYGIVMIGIYNSNKELYTYKVTHSFLLYHLSM